MSKSPTTTDDLPPNPHPGYGLRDDLLGELGVSVEEVARSTGVDAIAIDEFLDGGRRIDASFDLRLTRYFGFSEGYLLRLQASYDLMEARRALGPELDAIVPLGRRAA